jgi:hypothetical protein
MSKSKFFVVLVILAVLFTIPIFAGCGKVAEYADPITENIMVAMNNADYSSFSKDFDETMKSELSAEAFPDFISAVNGKVGNYIENSKKIVGVSIENSLTTAKYTAKFEKAESVNVEVTFKKINGQNKVVGLWFK